MSATVIELKTDGPCLMCGYDLGPGNWRQKMKIGWLVYEDDYDDAPKFWMTEPESWRGRIVQIVYAEIESA